MRRCYARAYLFHFAMRDIWILYKRHILISLLFRQLSFDLLAAIAINTVSHFSPRKCLAWIRLTAEYIYSLCDFMRDRGRTITISIGLSQRLIDEMMMLLIFSYRRYLISYMEITSLRFSSLRHIWHFAVIAARACYRNFTGISGQGWLQCFALPFAHYYYGCLSFYKWHHHHLWKWLKRRYFIAHFFWLLYAMSHHYRRTASPA